jgi:hypothetical protein
MIEKRRGWLRLGVVVSVLWLLGWGFEGGYNAGRFNLQSAEKVSEELSSCLQAERAKPLKDRYRDCFEEWRTNFKFRPRKNLLQEAGSSALISSLFIPFLWLLGAVAISVIRWVRDGFR